jgi:FlaA1/EpsC-like NDP-sugar epimerase
MPAAARLNRLAERKRLLVLEADLHRHLLAIERMHWQERVDTAREQVQAGRWWLIVGAAIAGWLLARRLGGVARWLPAARTAARIAQSLSG